MSERELKAEIRNLKTHLTSLVLTAEQTIRLIDGEMKMPSTSGRGKIIARLLNALEMCKDRAKRYGLNLDFDGKPIRKKRAKGAT